VVYRIEKDADKGAKAFAAVDGVPAKTYKTLGPVQIGLGPEVVPKH
jgi:hypothetical protein